MNKKDNKNYTEITRVYGDGSGFKAIVNTPKGSREVVVRSLTELMERYSSNKGGSR